VSSAARWSGASSCSTTSRSSISGPDPWQLKLEVTEGVLMESFGQDVEAFLRGLAARGVRLATDDFGTSYSSLAYLKRLPVQKIKVDRSFVRDIGADPEDEAVVRAIATLGHALGKEGVAEGVETEAQLAFLRRLGCDEAQGFLLGRPQPSEEISRLLTTASDGLTEPSVEAGESPRTPSAATKAGVA
jgi:diguanylate cyclase